MKKSTAFLLLLTFFVGVVILVGLFVTIMVLMMQGSTPNLLGSKRLALIRVEGVIYDAEEWIDQVKEYQDDSSIEGIVLRVESPGGAVGPSQDLYQALLDAKEKHGKVIVASFGSVAASGGYYVACCADQIVSAPGAMTGSIGVYAKFPVAKELMEKIGVAYETVKAGEYKDFGSLDRGLTDKERQMMQGVIDDTYDQFIEAVMTGRKNAFTNLLNAWDQEAPFEYPLTSNVAEIAQTYKKEGNRDIIPSASETASLLPEDASAATTIEDVSKDMKSSSPNEKTLLAFTRAIAEGKVYTGRQAIKVGLVDQIGTLDDAIHLCARMVGIHGEPTVVERKQKSYGLLDFLSEKMNMFITTQQTYSPLQYRFPY